MKPILFKVIAGTVAIIGIVLGYLDRMYAPTYLVTSDSPSYPDWLRSFGWWMASTAAIVYFIADIVEHRHRREKVPLSRQVSDPARSPSPSDEHAGTDNQIGSTLTKSNEVPTKTPDDKPA